MPIEYFQNEDLWNKIQVFIESFGVDLENLKLQLDAAKKLISSLKSSFVFSKTKSINSMDREPNSASATEPESPEIPSPTKVAKAVPYHTPTNNQIIVQDAFQGAEHAFVKYSGPSGANKFCEHCFLEPGQKESLALYRCESIPPLSNS
jgi:hypothetical protein